MSYHFKDSGYPGEDYLIVTKKGKEERNLPDGIILLGGLMYCDMDFRNWIREAEQNGYYVYPAKHCNDEHEVTHISEFGFVNRFGFFITKEPLFVHSHEDIMIGQGWFVRKHTTDFTKALEVLESKTKGGRD